jgi:hypothetical protein
MTHCRMCSQRLPRPGRLCRECERELDRARATAESAGNLSSALPLIDAARMATADSAGASGRFKSRPTVLVAAFSVGIATAAALYLFQQSHATDPRESVMIDRDLSGIAARTRAYETTRADPSAAVPHTQVAPRKTPREAERREPVMMAIASTGARSPAQPDEATPLRAAAPVASLPAAYDRVLGLADALDACAHESLFDRMVCEHRARTRFCEGAEGQIAQCIQTPQRDYGQ